MSSIYDDAIWQSRSGRRWARQFGGTLTDAQWEAIKAAYGCCVRCGVRDQRLVPDHVVPLWRGGKHEDANIQPLCDPCNIAKGSQIIDFRDGRLIGDTSPEARPTPSARARGERHHKAKLTALDVRAIRIASDLGASIEELLRAYPVTHNAIYKVIHRQSWRHVR